MKVSDSSVGGEVGQFHTTRWTLVLASARDQSQTGRAALAALCQIYWYPLYAFARRRGYSPPDAQDLTQGFSCTFWNIGDSAGSIGSKASSGHFCSPVFRTIFQPRRTEPTDSSEVVSVSLFRWTWKLPKIVIDTNRGSFNRGEDL